MNGWEDACGNTTARTRGACRKAAYLSPMPIGMRQALHTDIERDISKYSSRCSFRTQVSVRRA